MITEQDGPVFAQLVIDQDFEAFQTFIGPRSCSSCAGQVCRGSDCWDH